MMRRNTTGLICVMGTLLANPTPVRAGESLSTIADGQQDATAAIQALLDRAGQIGVPVRLPAGQFRIDGSLRVPTGVAMIGQWEGPHHGAWQVGTTLLVYGGRGKENGPATIALQQSAMVKGVTLVWPEQRIDDVQPYPWAIKGTAMHGTVENITLVNAYLGVGFDGHELSVIRNVFGCVLRTGILIDGCFDISRVENVHFNPHYWERSGHPSRPTGGDGKPHPNMQVARYMNEHLEAFVFGKSDWQYCTNTFVFGCKIGYKFIRGERGACNGQFVGIGADAAQCGIYVEDSQPIAIHVTNGQFAPFWGDHPKGVYTGPRFKGSLQLSTCSFWGPMHQVAVLEGDARVSFNQCQFHQWDDQKTGLAAIEARAGKLIVQACQFDASGKQDIRLHEGVRTAIIQGNLSPDGVSIDNGIGDRALVSLNDPGDRPVEKK